MTTGELRGRCRQPSKNQRAGQYRGVRWDKKSNAWQASISAGGQRTPGGRRRQLHLGYYDDPAVAASAYDLVARAAFGETALCNFPLPGPAKAAPRAVDPSSEVPGWWGPAAPPVEAGAFDFLRASSGAGGGGR